VLNYSATDVASAQKEQPIVPLKRIHHFQTPRWLWNEQKFGIGGPEQRATVLAKARNNLLHVYVVINIVK
jgi:hypothetical protein